MPNNPVQSYSAEVRTSPPRTMTFAAGLQSESERTSPPQIRVRRLGSDGLPREPGESAALDHGDSYDVSMSATLRGQ